MIALQAMEDARYVTAEWVRENFTVAMETFTSPGEREDLNAACDLIVSTVLTAIANGQENAAELASAVTESMAALDA